MFTVGFKPKKVFLDDILETHRDNKATCKEIRTHLQAIEGDTYVGRYLALFGRADLVTQVGMVTKEGVIYQLKLDDVDVTCIEFIGGDDPSLTRAENRADLRMCIKSANERLLPGFCRPDNVRPGHFADLLDIYDRVVDNVGFQPKLNYVPMPKTGEFCPSDEFIVGDTVRWNVPWPIPVRIGKNTRGEATIVVDVIRESPGINSNNPDLFMFARREPCPIDSYPRAIGTWNVIPGNMYIHSEVDTLSFKNVQRAVWVNENLRAARVKQVITERNASTAR